MYVTFEMKFRWTSISNWKCTKWKWRPENVCTSKWLKEVKIYKWPDLPYLVFPIDCSVRINYEPFGLNGDIQSYRFLDSNNIINIQTCVFLINVIQHRHQSSTIFKSSLQGHHISRSANIWLDKQGIKGAVYGLWTAECILTDKTPYFIPTYFKYVRNLSSSVWRLSVKDILFSFVLLILIYLCVASLCKKKSCSLCLSREMEWS